ncbi:hypothetical protein FI667_g12051, partial [Globisporangium splendens]
MVTNAAPPLTSARVVCRSIAALAALPHVAAAVSKHLDYATPAYWSVLRACKRITKRDAEANHHSWQLLYRVLSHPDNARVEMDPYYKMHQCNKVLVIAVQANRLDLVKLLSAYCPNVFALKAMEEAARRGNVEILEWFASNHGNAIWHSNFLRVAAANGQIEALDWLQQRVPREQSVLANPMYAAAANGQFDVVKWIAGQENAPNAEDASVAFASAIDAGRLDIAKYLYDRYDLGSDPTRYHRVLFLPMDHAAQYGYLDVMQWLHEIGIDEGSETAMDNAATNGYLPILQWLHVTYRDGATSDAMDKAAANGHLHVVQWLHANRSEGCTSDALDEAAANGHMHVVRWLHANRREGCTRNAMDGAAMNGHLEIVQWLHVNRSEGCTSRAMDGAATYGHLELVKWLHENRSEGCTYLAMNGAALNGHFDVIQWLHTFRHADVRMSRAIDNAAKGGYLHIIKWLHEVRQERCSTNAMDWAAGCGHFDIVQWLHANRSEGSSTEAMDNAARYGHFEIVKWLHTNRHEGCTPEAMDNAKSVEILRWLHENRREGCTTDAMDNSMETESFEKLLFLKANRSEGCSPTGPSKAACSESLEVVLWAYENYRHEADIPSLRQSWGDREYLMAVFDTMGLALDSNLQDGELALFVARVAELLGELRRQDLVEDRLDDLLSDVDDRLVRAAHLVHLVDREVDQCVQDRVEETALVGEHDVQLRDLVPAERHIENLRARETLQDAGEERSKLLAHRGGQDVSDRHVGADRLGDAWSAANEVELHVRGGGRLDHRELDVDIEHGRRARKRFMDGVGPADAVPLEVQLLDRDLEANVETNSAVEAGREGEAVGRGHVQVLHYDVRDAVDLDAVDVWDQVELEVEQVERDGRHVGVVHEDRVRDAGRQESRLHRDVDHRVERRDVCRLGREVDRHAWRLGRGRVLGLDADQRARGGSERREDAELGHRGQRNPAGTWQRARDLENEEHLDRLVPASLLPTVLGEWVGALPGSCRA